MRSSIVKISICVSAALAVAWADLSIAQQPKDEILLPGAPLPTAEVTTKPASTPVETQAVSGEEQKRFVSVCEALATSNLELETLREHYEQLKLQMEAIGVAAIKGDERSLQQRLLKAVADLRATEKDRLDLAEKSSRLAEAAAAHMSNPSSAPLKGGLEEAIKNVVSVKKSTSGDAVSLEAARVVSYKPDIGLAVINVGRQSGVRMGIPLRVVRADRSIANGLIVDVRDRISGLLITGSVATALRAGDAVKPEVTNPSPKQ